MQLVEAYEVLGVSSNASAEELTQSYVRLRASFEAGILRASNESIKEKFQKQLDDLEAARQVLLPNYRPTPPPMDERIPTSGTIGTHANVTPPGLFDTPLTATQFADLPTPSDQLGVAMTYAGSGSSTPGYAATPPITHPSGGTDMSAVPQGLSISPGQTLLNRYDVKGVLGVGGMGAVYGAYDRVLGQEVALKVLLPQLAKNPAARERFLHEARISISLTHPHIANVKEVQTEGELCFLTMELLRGRTLRKEIEAKSDVKMPFSAKEVIELCKPICEALNYAHQYTVHRDIKPENIWLGKDGSMKVMDFGIAQLLSPTRMTQTAMAMGTAFYMAPEQMQSAKEVDRRADQYSLAVVIYELLAGKLPTGRAKALAEIRSDIPAPLSAAVDKALSTNPNDRYSSMEEFFQAISKKGRTAHGKKKLLVAMAVLAGVAGATVVGVNEKLRTGLINSFKSPTAPSSLVVQREGKLIKVSWKDTSPGLTTGFLVQRQQAGTDKPEPFDKPANMTQYVDDVKLMPGTRYTYNIVAKGKKEFLSEPSASQSIETLPGSPEPITISKVEPLPNDPEHSLQVIWGAGLGNGLQRSVERMEEDTNKWEALPVTPNDFAAGKFQDSDLKPDTKYSYRMVLANEGGKTEGPLMAQFTNPPKPDKFDAKLTEDKKIELIWNAPLKEDRQLALKRGGREVLELSPEDVKSQRFVLPEAEPGSSHDFSLVIVGPNKQLGAPATANLTVPPSAPQQVIVKSGPTSMDLQWEKLDKGAKEIEILRKEGDGEFTSLAKQAAALTKFTDKNVTAGQKYAYKIVALNSGGPSDPGEPSEPQVARLPPPTPPKLVPQAKEDKKEIRVAWNFGKKEDLDGLQKLVIERATNSEGPFMQIREIGPPFALTGSFDDSNGLADKQEYFYRMNVFANHYVDPFPVFSQPVIPKIQAVVVGAPAGGPPGPGASPVPTVAVVFGVPQPTPAIFRPDDPDTILTGLSTPTPTPQAGKNGGGGGGGGGGKKGGAPPPVAATPAPKAPPKFVFPIKPFP